jgi:hypothetical protein
LLCRAYRALFEPALLLLPALQSMLRPARGVVAAAAAVAQRFFGLH